MTPHNCNSTRVNILLEYCLRAQCAQPSVHSKLSEYIFGLRSGNFKLNQVFCFDVIFGRSTHAHEYSVSTFCWCCCYLMMMIYFSLDSFVRWFSLFAFGLCVNVDISILIRSESSRWNSFTFQPNEMEKEPKKTISVCSAYDTWLMMKIAEQSSKH